ncbi:MAG: Bug family tripartite tricarboxylate transporter substrate binding protein [Methanocella sp.]
MKKNVHIAACLLLAAALPAGAQTSGNAAQKGKTPTAPAASAPAKNYPIKPIRFIVPFAPGGTTDIVARFIGQKLGDDLGQPLIIDNRGGAGGTIGTDMLAIALPDGYTIMLNHVGLTYNVSLYERLPYDTIKDLAPVSLVGTTPNMLVVNTAFKARSVKELVDLARAKPDQLSYGSGGVGSSSHLAVEMLQQIAKVKFLHVPYKGAGPALTDTVSGQVQFMITTMPSAVNHVKSGRLRALAVSGSKRSPAMPELPTVMESGVPGYDYTTWYGILAPAGLPKPIAARLLQSVHAAVASPDLRGRLLQNGMEPEVNTPDRFAALIKSDISKWSKIIRTAGIKGEQ